MKKNIAQLASNPIFHGPYKTRNPSFGYTMADLPLLITHNDYAY